MNAYSDAMAALQIEPGNTAVKKCFFGLAEQLRESQGQYILLAQPAALSIAFFFFSFSL